MSPANFASIIHLAGFVTGIALYAMLLLMTSRIGVVDRAAESPGSLGERLRASVMPVSVGMLGLFWNAIALILFAARDFHFGTPSLWLSAVGFSALGFLPAVVVHSAVLPQPMGTSGRWLTRFAYLLSTAGAFFQFVDASHGVAPSSFGLLTLTFGFVAILVVWPFVARQSNGRHQSLLVIALAAFAVSALHLSHPEGGQTFWGIELIGHHASLPLVLVILYQDYRFALADLFLRRALSLVMLVGTAIVLQVAFSDRLNPLSSESLLTTMRHIALLVVSGLLYPYLRAGVGQFVDRVVLDRIDYSRVREQLVDRFQDAVTSLELLKCATDSIALALGAQNVTFEVAVGGVGHSRMMPRGVFLSHIPTVDAPQYTIRIADLAGGRRLLSDDLALLDWLALTLARRIDAIRVANERHEQGIREREILRLATEAELRALRAQLNPHFLFNALTTIGFLLQASPERALQTLYRLTHLLRSVLRRSAGTFITLGEEVELVESYLSIERERFEERLMVTIDVPATLRHLRIPPLLLQPLVENAIKHGITPLARGGSVLVQARKDMRIMSGSSAEWLTLSVVDTGAGVSRDEWKSSEGIGLSNIRARLATYYGQNAELTLTTNGDRGAYAQVTIPVDLPAVSDFPLKAAG